MRIRRFQALNLEKTSLETKTKKPQQAFHGSVTVMPAFNEALPPKYRASILEYIIPSLRREAHLENFSCLVDGVKGQSDDSFLKIALNNDNQIQNGFSDYYKRKPLDIEIQVIDDNKASIEDDLDAIQGLVDHAVGLFKKGIETIN